MKSGHLQELPQLPVSHDPAIKKRVLLKKGDVPHVTQYSQSTFQPGQVAGAHSHPDMYEIFFCVAGHGTAVVNGEVHKLTPGTFILLEPHDTHEIRNDGTEPLVLNQLGVAE